MKKSKFSLMLISIILLALCACRGTAPAASAAGSEIAGKSTVPAASGYQPEQGWEKTEAVWDKDKATYIHFDGAEIRIEGTGAQKQGSCVTISRSGTYVLSGETEDGRVLAQVEKGETLIIVLNGVKLHSSTAAPLYIANGDAVVILPEGTQNGLSDAPVYQLEDSVQKKPNACLCGDDNLTIAGSGELDVIGNCNNGIGTKDELRIESARLTVQAANNALKGNECVLIRDAVLELDSQGDGIKSDKDTKPGYGVISIENSSMTIKAEDDALQAISRVSASGGEIRLQVKGKRINCDGQVLIAEGVLR